MEIVNSNCGISNIRKIGSSILNSRIINHNRTLNTVSKPIHLTFLPSQNQTYLLNNTSKSSNISQFNPKFNSKKNLSSLIQHKINGISLSSNLIETKIILKNSKKQYIQLNNNNSIVNDIIKKNALNGLKTENCKNSNSQIHTGMFKFIDKNFNINNSLIPILINY